MFETQTLTLHVTGKKMFVLSDRSLHLVNMLRLYNVYLSI